MFLLFHKSLKDLYKSTAALALHNHQNLFKKLELIPQAKKPVKFFYNPLILQPKKESDNFNFGLILKSHGIINSKNKGGNDDIIFRNYCF